MSDQIINDTLKLKLIKTLTNFDKTITDKQFQDIQKILKNPVTQYTPSTVPTDLYERSGLTSKPKNNQLTGGKPKKLTTKSYKNK